MLTPEWALDPLPPMTGAAARTFVVGGATGFIGAHLVRRLLARGDRVIVVTRRPRHALARFGPQVTILTAPEALPVATQVDGIVSLAGAPILHTPWTRGRRALLLHSRVATVGALAALSQRLERPPAAFVAASAIGTTACGAMRRSMRAPAAPRISSRSWCSAGRRPRAPRSAGARAQ